MSTPVTLPALGESVTEGTVTRWLKQVGDTVAVDEPLLEVSTDKVDTEIPSPVAGVLLEITAAATGGGLLRLRRRGFLGRRLLGRLVLGGCLLGGRFLRGCLLGRGFLGRGFLRRRLLGRSRAATLALLADHAELGADLDGLVLLRADLQEHAGDRRGDLRVDLVGRDLQQRLVDRDGVAHLLEPAGDGALGD